MEKKLEIFSKYHKTFMFTFLPQSKDDHSNCVFNAIQFPYLISIQKEKKDNEASIEKVAKQKILGAQAKNMEEPFYD